MHLLLRTGNLPIATVMQMLLTGYAVQFNRRHQCHDHVFQNRYKSILCQQEPHLKEIVRYIHLIPLRAKLVANYQSLKNFGDSGHCAVMGKHKIKWQNTQCVLALFGKKLSEARRLYAKYVEAEINDGKRSDLTG